jgi:DNA-binding transcriptional ArsR family regulator
MLVRELSDIAALFADRSRVRMLDELMSAEAVTAGVLAARAGIAPSTASKHLARLEAHGLVTITSRGRTREVRLAGPEVAAAIEALGRLARPAAPSGLRDVNRMTALRHARSCYDHLAGQLGVALTDTLIDHGALRAADGALAAADSDVWPALGIDLAAIRAGAGRRQLARPCPDWTERRPHLAGALGAAVLHSLIGRDWIRRRPGGRALTVTTTGTVALQALGVTAASPHTLA